MAHVTVLAHGKFIKLIKKGNDIAVGPLVILTALRGGKLNKLYFKKNFLIISRNLASPQQIEQVRLPSVCASFPVRSTVIVPTFSLRANIYIVPPKKNNRLLVEEFQMLDVMLNVVQVGQLHVITELRLQHVVAIARDG